MSVGAVVPVAAETYAQLEDARMDVLDHGRKFKHGKHHKKRAEVHRIVSEYMLQQGDISQAELDARDEQRKAVHKELRALRASGDEAALKARLGELREQRKAHRAKMKAYISEHDDLAALLKERRQAFKEKHKSQ